MAAGRTRATALVLDVKSSDLDRHIAEHDLVISLVPFIHHADVIRSAIKGKTNVVTTSYVSPAMRELDEPAKAAGITVLNEVGVDPGVDHLYAVQFIGDVHEKGGKVRLTPRLLYVILFHVDQGVLLLLRRTTRA